MIDINEELKKLQSYYRRMGYEMAVKCYYKVEEAWVDPTVGEYTTLDEWRKAVAQNDENKKRYRKEIEAIALKESLPDTWLKSERTGDTVLEFAGCRGIHLVAWPDIIRNFVTRVNNIYEDAKVA